MIYTRAITIKLWILRLSGIFLTAACILSFSNHHTNAGYFLAVLCISLGLICIKNIRVFTNYFQVEKYYLFGWIKRKWLFRQMDNIALKSVEKDFGAQEDYEVTDPGGSALGCMASIIAIFLKGTVTIREFTIEKSDNDGNIKGSVYITLNQEEYWLLQRFAEQAGSLDA